MSNEFMSEWMDEGRKGRRMIGRKEDRKGDGGREGRKD